MESVILKKKKKKTVDGKWKSILIAKYDFTGLEYDRLSSFWCGVLDLIQIFDMSINKIVGDGSTTCIFFVR